MGKYLKDRVRLAIKVLNEVDYYLDGQQSINNNYEQIIEIEYDKSNNSYILPDGLSEDEFFNLFDAKDSKIKNNDNIAKENSIKKKEEEIELTKLKEGTLRKRNDGRWEARYYDCNIQKSVYAKTQKDCIKKLKKALKSRDKKEINDIVNRKTTLIEWIIKWVDLYKSDLKPSTKNDYQKNLILKVKNHPISRKLVTEINIADLTVFFKSIKKPATKARTFRQMKSCFNSLFKSRFIDINPFDYIKPILEPKPNRYTPSRKELDSFFKYLKTAYYEIYLFAKFISLTGLRKGEALALTWDDINNSSITINKAWERKAAKVQSVKTGTSNRVIPLFPKVIDHLKEIKPLSDGSEIFSFIYKNAISSRFRVHRNKFGLEKLTLHSLRHYFATECLEAGIEKKVVQKWLGHSNYKTTSDIYSHINNQFEQKQIEILAKYRKKV